MPPAIRGMRKCVFFWGKGEKICRKKKSQPGDEEKRNINARGVPKKTHAVGKKTIIRLEKGDDGNEFRSV